ncbi:MAG TPA: FtsX-like permease family protein, partial [Vicinamibacterales bacterium]|nr:FtsX-like permease family protein [Vicinamibacterales bacterium]
CSTMASLLLSRARARVHEMAVRIALGASRTRLALLCLADSLFLTAAGGALGLVLGWWTASLFPLLFFAEDAETLAMAPDPAWLAIAGVIWIVVVLVCGLAPMLIVPNRYVWQALRDDAIGVPGGSGRARSRLVTGQIGVCCLLVVLAGVIREDLQSTLRTARGLAIGSLIVAASERGIIPDDVRQKVLALNGVSSTTLLATLPTHRMPLVEFQIERARPRTRELVMDAAVFDPLSRPVPSLRPRAGRSFAIGDVPGGCMVAVINETAAARYFADAAVGRFMDDPAGRRLIVVGVMPDVAAESGRPAMYYYANQVPPFVPARDARFFTAPVQPSGAMVELAFNSVSPEYFATFADPPIVGRAFTGADVPGACPVAVVSAETARVLFEGDAVGGALIDPFGQPIEIVGVVEAAPMAAAQQTSPPLALFPFAQRPELKMRMAIRASDTSVATRKRIDDVLATANLPIGPVKTFEEHLARSSLAPERVASALVGLTAGIAIALSVVGVYGAMADMVVRRRRELALRIALGARALGLVMQVVRQGLKLAGTGAAAGLVAALIATPFVGQIVRHPRWPGVLVVGLVGLALLTIVTLACAVPAWRAVGIDPKEAMRAE